MCDLTEARVPKRAEWGGGDASEARLTPQPRWLPDLIFSLDTHIISHHSNPINYRAAPANSKCHEKQSGTGINIHNVSPASGDGCARRRNAL